MANDRAVSGAAQGAAAGATVGGPWGAVIGGGLGLVGGIMGDSAAADAQKKADALAAQRQALLNGLTVPDQTVNYASKQVGSMLDPRLQVADQLASHDALQNVNLDPRLAASKMNALQTLQSIAGHGFTPDEMNALQSQRSARESDLTSKLKAIQQQQDMRGVGNSDMALSQRMLEAQGSANRGAQDARDLQAQGYKRSLDAISAGGNLANQYENTDYLRQENLANALNNRERVNFNETSNVNKSNTDRFNNALATNFNRQNSIADSNTNLQNSQQDMRNQLGQNAYDNKFKKIKEMIGSSNSESQRNINETSGRNARTGGMLEGIGQIGAGLISANNSSGDTVSAQNGNTGNSGYTGYKSGSFGNGGI